MKDLIKDREYFYHPTAIIEKGAKIGKDTKIWHFVHIREGARIGSNCNISKDVYIDHHVKIGSRVKIENGVSVYHGVTLGDDIIVSPNVSFTNDLTPRAYLWDKTRLVRTKVKKGASIGAGAIVVCGNVISEYAMIGAGAVVTKNVPPFALMKGNPARISGFVCFCGVKIGDIEDLLELFNNAGTKLKYLRIKCDACGKEVALATKILQGKEKIRPNIY